LGKISIPKLSGGWRFHNQAMNYNTSILKSTLDSKHYGIGNQDIERDAAWDSNTSRDLLDGLSEISFEYTINKSNGFLGIHYS